MLRSLRSITLLSMIVTASAAEAQEAPRVGLLMATPRTVGVVLHVGDRLALRPDATWSRVSSESSTGAETEATSWTAGLAGVWYLKAPGTVNLYLSPRVAYVSTTSDAGGSSTTKGMEYSGSFGAEYVAAPRLRFFGETGLALSASESKQAAAVMSSSDLMSIRSSVGLVLYFGR